MKSTERWYVTDNDEAVREGDPRARRLLVCAGGDLPDEVARKYGILEETKASYGAKSVEAAPENKAVEMPAEPKRKRKIKYG